MNAVPFDTLKTARKLEASGIWSAVAAGTAEALAEGMSGAELATKADIAGLRAELKADDASLRAELKADIGALRKDMELMGRDIVIKLGGMIVVAVGVMVAALRYMPPHP
jgi:hypothetical protein